MNIRGLFSTSSKIYKKQSHFYSNLRRYCFLTKNNSKNLCNSYRKSFSMNNHSKYLNSGNYGNFCNFSRLKEIKSFYLISYKSKSTKAIKSSLTKATKDKKEIKESLNFTSNEELKTNTFTESKISTEDNEINEAYTSTLTFTSISRDLYAISVLFNGCLYFSSAYIGLIFFGFVTPSSEILITTLSRLSLKHIYVINSIWGGINLGYLMSKQDDDLESEEDKSFFSRMICLSFTPGLISYFISQKLLNSSALSVSLLNISFSGYTILQVLHLIISYNLAKKGIAPYQYFKFQVALALLNFMCMFIVYFYFKRNSNEKVLCKKETIYSINDLKYIEEIMQVDDELMSMENEELFEKGLLEKVVESKVKTMPNKKL